MLSGSSIMGVLKSHKDKETRDVLSEESFAFYEKTTASE